MMVKRFIKEQLQEMDHPVKIPVKMLGLKKAKLRLIIINEDLSYREFFMNYPKSYSFDVKDKSYILVPRSVIRGKIPTLVYYFNNPFPLEFKFQYSETTALDLRNDPRQIEELTQEQKTLLTNINLDAETLNLAFTTRVMRGLYWESKLTGKMIVIILIIVAVVILVILQATGTVDIFSIFSSVK